MKSLRAELEEGVELVLTDLDYTITSPNGLHSELIQAVFEVLGVRSLSLVQDTMKSVRGKAYDHIFESILDACIAAGEISCDIAQVWQSVDRIVEEIVTGQREFKAVPQLLPGANEFLQLISQFKIPLKVCTASPRPFAFLSLTRSDLSRDLKRIPIFGAGDVQHHKSHPAYWKECAGDKELTKVLVFEDRAPAVNAALEAGVRRVFFRPSREEERGAKLANATPDRLVQVQEWTELL